MSVEPVFHPHGDANLPFARAVRVGDIIYLSGQIGIEEDGSLAPDLGMQARRTMENIRSDLVCFNLGFVNVFHCTIMMADITQWAVFNEIYLEYFDLRRLPARSAFGAAGLALGALVEVECKAYLSVEFDKSFSV